MVLLTARQEFNLRAALATTDNEGQRLRLVFAIWTESRALVYANSGLNTSKSPGFDTHPQWPVILRRSLLMRHDAIGNNGRSTGMLQQISDDVGGGWGSMTGTMDPATSARRFLAALRVTNNATYTGVLLTPTGSRRVTVQLSDPIAADVLRVQQPLADEALSANYDASQVAIARQIVNQLTTPEPEPDWWALMAENFEEAKQELRDMFHKELPEIVRQVDIGGSPLAMVLQTLAVDRGHDIRETARFVRGTDPNIDALSVLLDGLTNLRKENAQIIKLLTELTTET